MEALTPAETRTRSKIISTIIIFMIYLYQMSMVEIRPIIDNSTFEPTNYGKYHMLIFNIFLGSFFDLNFRALYTRRISNKT